jgi:hypothetical protein
VDSDFTAAGVAAADFAAAFETRVKTISNFCRNSATSRCLMMNGGSSRMM